MSTERADSGARNGANSRKGKPRVIDEARFFFPVYYCTYSSQTAIFFLCDTSRWLWMNVEGSRLVVSTLVLHERTNVRR